MLPLIPKISKIIINHEDLARLKNFKGKRVILTSNHAEMTEPYAIFYLSRLLREEFNYLTAREVFEEYFPAGRLLQALGCYSVVRGTPDRSALRATTEILIKGKNWLVIFPEGVSAGLSDTLMPFQPGIGQFAFRAFEELKKEGEDPNIYFIPCAVKTFYVQNMHKPIDCALSRLEARLHPDSAPGNKNYQDRLLSLGEALLESKEQEYGVLPQPEALLSERISVVKETIITTIARQIGVEDHPEQILPDRLRDLINAIDRISHQQYQKKLDERESNQIHRDRAKALRRSLETATNFMALDTCYLEQQMTTERFLDIVGLLEREVFGRRRFWGQRKAIIKVGEPVDVNGYEGQYRINKRETFQAIASNLEAKVRDMVLELSSQSEPMK
jgi:1-acyl-sn-glycerol-3-phosphate acyltransferase